MPEVANPAPAPPGPQSAPPLREVIRLFLRLGFTAFGGPAAHIGLLERECVDRRRWLDHRHFLDMLAITNLLPGPNSTEMVIHLGYVRAGWAGLIAAGLAFILPAATLTLLIAWLYQEYRVLPAVAAVFKGIQPVMLAVIAGAVVKLGRGCIKRALPALLAAAALAAGLAGVNELLVLGVAAAVGWAGSDRGAGAKLAAWLPTSLLGTVPPLPLMSNPDLLPKMTLLFLKTGAVLFGSGYLLVNFLRADFVVDNPLLSEPQLLDAIAVGHFTPGPLLSAATFIGYQLCGLVGAAAATVAIFLPAFLCVALVAGRFEQLRTAPAVSGVLAAVNPAVVGLMAAVSAQLFAGTCMPTGQPDGYALGAFALSAGFVLGLGYNTIWLLPPAAVAGYLTYLP